MDTFRGKLRVGPPYAQQLDPRYLPQAFAQMLPQLLPVDRPNQYWFAYYVSDQHTMMSRFVDVGVERAVTIDGRSARAVPITDRIGADGPTTTHYVTRDNEWLGTVSDDGRLQVLPTDTERLHAVWPDFVEPPPVPPHVEVVQPVTHRDPDAPPAASRLPMPIERRGVDDRSFDGR